MTNRITALEALSLLKKKNESDKEMGVLENYRYDREIEIIEKSLTAFELLKKKFIVSYEMKLPYLGVSVKNQDKSEFVTFYRTYDKDECELLSEELL